MRRRPCWNISWLVKFVRESFCRSGSAATIDGGVESGSRQSRSYNDAVIEIVAIDDAFIVVNKPSGLLSVPGRGPDKQDCLSARVVARFADALTVHRLDMETSGLMVFARGIDAQRALGRAFERRAVEKHYEAVVSGLVTDDRGTIDLPLICDWPNRPRQIVDHVVGKQAVTHYEVMKRDEPANTTRVSLRPITGRSHQLRVHMASLGHAIIGDSLYALCPPPKGQRLLLHAAKLSFPHPVSGELVHFASDVPF
jgi:tRNA pseudouridine32 synthase / 23S rRNA pseudouridine746 synthase